MKVERLKGVSHCVVGWRISPEDARATRIRVRLSRWRVTLTVDADHGAANDGGVATGWGATIHEATANALSSAGRS